MSFMMRYLRTRAYWRGFGARQAARKRLPLWLRFLMPLMFITSLLFLTAGSIILLWLVHWALHPSISFNSVSGGAISLMFYSSFFGLMAPALMLLNFCIHVVPSLRRVFDANIEAVPGASYRHAMKGLQKIAVILAIPALVLALTGATEPWAF